MSLTFRFPTVIMDPMKNGTRSAFLKDERLSAVFDMIGYSPLVADVGCDHGYLSAALVSEGRAKRAAASDISPFSVEKARALFEKLGIGEKASAVLADGLDPLSGEEPPYKAAICGMGGELIAGILDRNRPVAEAAELIVMQPMRGEAELREYLFKNGFGITDERVVSDSGRFYQIIAAKHGVHDPIPDWFPKDWFRFGWVMARKRDPNLLPLLRHYRAVYARELEKAKSKGNCPESVKAEIARTDALIEYMENDGNAAL